MTRKMKILLGFVFRLTVVLTLIALIPVGGGQAQGQSGQKGLGAFIGTPQDAGDGFRPFFIADMNGIWPSHQIEVCWEPGSEAFVQERTYVRNAVRTFIEGNSQYRFGDPWGPCDANSRPRMRIRVADVGPVSQVGYQQQPTLFGGMIAGPTQITLNFTFANWSASCATTSAFRQRCIETIAVHEFLHALGAIHEQLSAELPTRDPECWARYKDMSDVHGVNPRPLTEYDPDSIMNYCRAIYSEPTRLSFLDGVGLTRLSNYTALKANGR